MKSSSSPQDLVPSQAGRKEAPWFELLQHRFTPREIEEIHLTAQERNLTVNQWLEATLRPAIAEYIRQP